MKSNLFYGCTSSAEVQLRFDELTKVFTGQEEMLRVIRTEYSTLMNVLTPAQSEEPVDTAEVVKERATVAEKIKELQGRLNPEGLHLEICGLWLWCSGRTFQVKDTLKELGFRYSANKMSWYYRQDEHRSSNQAPVPLEIIREKYGVTEVSLR